MNRTTLLLIAALLTSITANVRGQGFGYESHFGQGFAYEVARTQPSVRHRHVPSQPIVVRQPPAITAAPRIVRTTPQYIAPAPPAVEYEIVVDRPITRVYAPVSPPPRQVTPSWIPRWTSQPAFQNCVGNT